MGAEMSELVAKFDEHRERVSRLVDYFRGQPILEALCQSWLDQIQEIEDALFEILLERNLDDAEGVQLETIGKIVGQTPLEQTQDLRTAIRARLLINRSSGTPEELILLLRLLLADEEEFALVEEYPAQVRVRILDPLTSFTPSVGLLLLDQADPAAVRMMITYSTDEPADRLQFGYRSPGSDPVYSALVGRSTFGFVNGSDIYDGGNLVAVRAR